MENLKRLLKNVGTFFIVMLTIIIGSPVGVIFILCSICVGVSLLAMPLLSLPVILYLLGLVGVAISLKYLHESSAKYLKLLRPAWWIAHISLLSLLWFGCWKFISVEYFPLTPTENYLCALISVILGVVSVSLPIIIGNTCKSLVEYQNKIIASIFKKEVAYRAMFWFVIPLLGISLFLFFFFHNPEYGEVKHLLENYIAAFILSSCIYSICIFVYFMHRFIEYAINTDEVVLDRVGKAIEKLSRQKGLLSIYDEYVEVYAQLLMKKGKEKSYVGLDDAFRQLSDFVQVVIDDNRINNYSANNEGAMRYQRFLTKYSQTFFNIWKLVYVNNPIYTYNFSIEYEKIVRKALEYSDQDVYRKLLSIYQRIAFEITEAKAEAIPFAGVIPWQWFFNIVRNSGFDVSKIHIVGPYLFLSMKGIVKKRNLVSFNLFISDTINNIWAVLDNNFPLSSPFQEIGINEREVNCMFTPGEYRTLLEAIKKKDTFGELRGFIKKRFTNNSISLIVAMIGSYCLFMKQYKFVKVIFEYNQPKESNIQFINKDISPDNVDVLLKWMNDYYLFQGTYLNLWDDHNDGGYWFYQYVSLLFYKLYENKNGRQMSVSYVVKNKQELEVDKFNLDRMKDNINTIDSKIIVSCGLSIDTRLAVIEEIHKLKEELNQYEKTVIQEQTLDANKVSIFKDQVNQYIVDSNPWMNVFSTLSSREDDRESKEWRFDIKDSQLVEKSFLAEEDSGLYGGFSHAIAEIIISKFAFEIERKLHLYARLNPMMDSNGNYLTKGDFRKKIANLTDHVVVLINYFNAYDFLSPEDFSSVNGNGPMARIKNGPIIYSIGDRYNETPRMLVFRASDFTQISVKQDFGKVEDLNTNPKRVDEIIKEKPDYLLGIASEEQEVYLKQRVEISFVYKFTLYAKEKPEVQVLSNI